MSDVCAGCHFWKVQPDYPTNGWCHRLPPVPSFQVAFDGSGAAQFETLWPNTAPDDWCGEHRETEAARVERHRNAGRGGY